MPRYRYWFLDDKEDEDAPWIKADDHAEAAELACCEMINEGDLSNSHLTRAIQLAVRDVDGGPAQMFEIYVDWNPTCVAHHRGELPEQDEQPNET
jgi:hypothetical protein